MVALCCGLVAGGELAAADWSVAPAPFRVRLQLAGNARWPAEVGYAEVWPGGLNPDRGVVHAFTAGGKKVDAVILWESAGQPLKILFDTSSHETAYDIYVDDTGVQRFWKPEAGLIWETRKVKAGAMNTWDKAWTTMKNATPIYGRGPVAHVFNGINPYGPTDNLAGYITGYFTAKQAGDYEFATVSDGTSYLRIDGKVVATHPPKTSGYGRRGEFSGKITLRAGRHQMDYLHFHREGPMAAEVAWKPPGARNFEVMPVEAFVPSAKFQTVSFEHSPAKPNQLYCEWETVEHNLVEDLALCQVELRVLGPKRTYRWKFDDGTAATGERVVHLFVHRGFHRVQLEALDGGRAPGTLVQDINVQPRWLQHEEWREGLFERQRKELLARDYSRTSVEDLGVIVKLAERLNEPKLLAHVGSYCLKRPTEFKSSQAEVFYWLGLHFQNPEVRDYAAAEKAWRTAMTLAGTNSTSPAKSALRLARLLANCFGKAEEALSLLRQLKPDDLDKDEQRLAKLVEGDALLDQGKADEARKLYAAAGNLVDEANVLQSVRRVARIESAQQHLQRGEFEDADEILKQIEWETPMERLSLETGLAMVRVHLGRKEYPCALYRCRRLLKVASVDTHRADLWYWLIETNLALGQKADAQDALGRLLKDHPYSEATARAKDKWGAGFGANGK